ncbi:MAG: methionine adenosyltransferase [Acidobacteria bacterium]|nr:MAG: methionine adenosyltransferase [Acidobacteriota bacterium]
MTQKIPMTAEHVAAGHPDKFCDQVADRYLDEALKLAGDDPAVRRSVRTAIECLAKDNLLIISGEVKLPAAVRREIDPVALAREVWLDIGYPSCEKAERLTVIDHIRAQSADIARGTDAEVGGAGDQGIMVGYATDETPEMMPREWVLARDLIMKLRRLQLDGTLPWLRADCKSQVSLAADGEVQSVILAVQHAPDVTQEEIRQQVYERVITPVIGEVPQERVTVNGTGQFVIGGPTGDAGVVGRKIVVDAYGPRVPVGGGAYSGKDASKVDRSAAYMARHIAKTIVARGDAKECTVRLAYGIGKHQPEMVTAVTDDGRDLSAWVRQAFGDLSPGAIIERLGLFSPNGWSYYQTAAHGHYGRDLFPWEKIADV